MTTPVSATQSVAASDPVDLSRISQDLGAYRRSTASHLERQTGPSWTTRPSTPHVVDASSLDFGFSIEDIPLVGDFLSMVSSLFHSAPSGLDGKVAKQDEALPPPALLEASTRKTEAPAPTTKDDALDLSRLLELEREAFVEPRVVTLTSDVPITEVTDESIEALKPALPAVSGLVNHPSNRLSPETLKVLQERYLTQLSKQG